MKQTIYKILPKKIKEHIETPYYRQFIELPPSERRNKLKNLSTPIYYIVLNYCYIYSLLAIFFDKTQNSKTKKG